MFKKDSYILGIILAIVSPAAAYGLLYLLMMILEAMVNKGSLLNEKSLVLLSLVPNLIILRFYFVTFKLEKTGRGVLLITFGLIILFFIFFHEW